MDHIEIATRRYERWLRTETPVIEADLTAKHRRMAESAFVFLRGTFYRWLSVWTVVCPEEADRPRVLAVGDLHLENFGTWRDAEGRLVWGVNDVDEACELPYTQDLIRLAASALLAIGIDGLSLTGRAACEAILEGYGSSLESGGRPFVLAERHRWLRRFALADAREPSRFWAKLQSHPRAAGPVPTATLRSLLPRGVRRIAVLRRVAGVGSLGRPRYVAIADSGGALIAREAKALVPSAAAWAFGRPALRTDVARVLARAVRVADPWFAARGRWIVRRLAPDCTRIELEEFPKKRDEAKLLRAMGWEAANLHLGTATRFVRLDLQARRGRWLERAATDMAAAVAADWRAWRSRPERAAR